ncbi:glycosyltransferase [Acidimangrovimonas sediminis]|uniref:glycosyltransferase n=1 Tax=Acidimangrovimonas sediminis TaxID=2056283 RepID=UPI000C7FE07B|nr:glycosyltransferase [Acidimangrovimonas sediminis]
MTEAAPPTARLLDLTRLVSRAGHPADTGIDRVERAYLDTLLARPEPLYALVRTTLGFVLLPPGGTAALRDRLNGTHPWGVQDLLGRLAQRRNPGRAAAEADLRRLALDRARPAGLTRLLGRLPEGFAYVNVGHANLSARVFAAVREVGGRVSVLIHDTIPLDHPQFASPGLPEAFAARIAAVARGADLVICNSEVTRSDAARHFAATGRVPPMIVSHLGTDRPRPDPAALPPGLPPEVIGGAPYFVTLGTIEPRKNLDLLLDIWEAAAGALPPLLIVGRRGWAGAATLARLDAPPPGVHLAGALSDGAVAALLAGSAGLLFPSLAEGYGLPPVEAAALGVPVLCGDLAIYRETLGDYPVYADPTDRYLWRGKIDAMAALASKTKGKSSTVRRSPRLPTWGDHFKPVLSLT